MIPALLKIIATAFLTAATLASTSAVSEGVSASSMEALTSTSDALKARKIDLSPASLLAALHHEDAHIHCLAAIKLAEDHNLDAIPAIKDALAVEADARARACIASALWSLHDPKGVETLHDMCSEPGASFDVLYQSVRELALISSSIVECYQALVDSLDRPDGDYHRNEILSFFPELYRQVSADKAIRIVQILEETLKDPSQSSYTHAQTSQALAKIGSPTSIPVLKDIILREQDPDLRASFEADLKTLERKP